MINKTFQATPKDVKQAWHLVDLKGLTLGRAATRIAELLIGKHKPTYTAHIDTGDYVVVINAEQLVVTGHKMDNKLYQSHSGHPGGFKEITLKNKLAKDPRKVVELAVRGMLPKNKLQTPRLRRLKVYTGKDHPHANHFK